MVYHEFNIASLLILIAFVLVLLCAVWRPGPTWGTRVHLGWLGMAFYFAAMLVR